MTYKSKLRDMRRETQNAQKTMRCPALLKHCRYLIPIHCQGQSQLFFLLLIKHQLPTPEEKFQTQPSETPITDSGMP